MGRQTIRQGPIDNGANTAIILVAVAVFVPFMLPFALIMALIDANPQDPTVTAMKRKKVECSKTEHGCKFKEICKFRGSVEKVFKRSFNTLAGAYRNVN